MSIIGKVLGLLNDNQDETGENLTGARITDFIKYFENAGDIARPDYFNVLITLPEDVTKVVGLNQKNLMFQCEAAELPGRNIEMIAIRHNAFLDRMPIDINYPEITLTFICRSDLLEKKLFDVWLEKMIGTREDANYGLVRYKVRENNEPSYSTTIKICQKFQLDTDLNASAIVLIDALPTQIASMPLNWNDSGFHKLSVTFAYRKWEDETIKFSDLNVVTYEDALNGAEETLPDSSLLDKVKTVVSVGRFADVYSKKFNSGEGLVKSIKKIF